MFSPAGFARNTLFRDAPDRPQLRRKFFVVCIFVCTLVYTFVSVMQRQLYCLCTSNTRLHLVSRFNGASKQRLLLIALKELQTRGGQQIWAAAPAVANGESSSSSSRAQQHSPASIAQQYRHSAGSHQVLHIAFAADASCNSGWSRDMPYCMADSSFAHHICVINSQVNLHTSINNGCNSTKLRHYSSSSSSTVLSPAQLTQALRSASNAQQLLHLLLQHGSSLNHIHAAAAASTLGAWQQRGQLKDAAQAAAAQQVLQMIEKLLLQPQQQQQQQHWQQPQQCHSHGGQQGWQQQQQQQGLHWPQQQQQQRLVLHQCGCRELSDIIWAVGVMRNTHNRLLPACKQLLLTKAATAERPEYLTKALYGLAKAGHQLQQQQLQQLLAVLLQPQLLQQAQARQISNAVWGVASMGKVVPQQQLQQLLGAFVGRLSEATAQGIASVLWAVATMQQQQQQQAQQMLEAFIAMLSQANPQEIATVAWAVAKQGGQLSEQQLRSLLRGFYSKASFAKPQDMSMMLSAVAQLAGPNCKLPQGQLQQITAAFVTNVLRTPGNNSIAVSGVVSALAKIEGEVMPARQLQQLLQAFSKWQNNASAQALSNVLHAVAKLKGRTQQQQQQQQQVWRQQQPLLLSLTESLARKVTTLSPQGVSLVLWACSELRLFPAELFEALGLGLSHSSTSKQQQQQQQWARLVSNMSLQELSTTALALGRLGHMNEAAMAVILQQAWKRLQHQQQQHWQDAATGSSSSSSSSSNPIVAEHSGSSSVAAADGSSTAENADDLDSSSNSSGSNGSSSDEARAVSNLCWAVAVLDLQELAGNVQDLAAAMSCRKAAWDGMTQQGMVQLHQVHVWLLDCKGLAVIEHDGLAQQGLGGALTPQQLQQCRDAAAAVLQSVVGSAAASDNHQAVFKTLQQLPLQWREPPQIEQLVQPDSAVVVDITGVLKSGTSGIRLAVEVDGPQHFRWPDQQLTGSTLYRNRALQRRGYVLVSVSFHEWRGWCAAGEQREQLLRQIHQQAQQQQQQQQVQEQ